MDPSGVPVTSLTSISYRSCLDTLATLTSCSRNSPGRSQVRVTPWDVTWARKAISLDVCSHSSPPSSLFSKIPFVGNLF